MRKSTKKAAVTVATPVAAAAPVALLTMNMSAALDVSELTGDAALDALMAELNSVSPAGAADDEIMLPSEPTEFETTLEAGSIGHDHPTDAMLANAVGAAEMLENYDKDADTTASDAVEPKAADAAEVAAAGKTGGRKKKDAAPKEPKAPKEAKAPKAPAAPKVFYGLDKVKRLSDRGVNAVMLKAEESMTGDDLAAAQQRTIDVVAKSNQKVKNRTTNILEFVTGKTNVLNNLIRVCFNLIEKDGVLVTGEKGNMWATLSVCYGAGTIRSGGNNSVAALRELQVIVDSGKGYVMNPESALYERIKARLTGGGVDEGTPAAEEPSGEPVGAPAGDSATDEPAADAADAAPADLTEEQQAEVSDELAKELAEMSSETDEVAA